VWAQDGGANLVHPSSTHENGVHRTGRRTPSQKSYVCAAKSYRACTSASDDHIRVEGLARGAHLVGKREVCIQTSSRITQLLSVPYDGAPGLVRMRAVAETTGGRLVCDVGKDQRQAPLMANQG